MPDALAVLARAKSNPGLKTASAFRVLIDVVPQLHASEFRLLKQLAIARATGLHRNRVQYALSQLLQAGVLEHRRTSEGNEYRFGRGVSD